MDGPESEGDFVGHIPVLPAETVQLIGPALEGESPILVDATIGLGGHARLFLNLLGDTARLIGLDADPAALEQARVNLGDDPRLRLFHANFAELPAVLESAGIGNVHVILADLGVSSMQLGTPERGFSFQREGPLDMRMDPRLKTTAADLVNRLKEKELGDLIFYNAQEFAARKVARRICEARRDARITTTERLAKIVASAVGVDNSASRRSRIHPATRTFQALRMAVNNEIPNLKSFLLAAPGHLAAGGRIGVITFHSIEDKEVKVDFRDRRGEGLYELVNKKPIIASMDERDKNPRSRSAKLRAAVRLPGK